MECFQCKEKLSRIPKAAGESPRSSALQRVPSQGEGAALTSAGCRGPEPGEKPLTSDPGRAPGGHIYA